MYRTDLKKIQKYAKECKFIIETGSGRSTKVLADVAIKYSIKFVSIEINKAQCKLKNGVEYMNGWSISVKDIIKIGDEDFCYRPYLFVEKYRKKEFSNKELLLIESRSNNFRKHKYYTKKEIDIVGREVAFGNSSCMMGEKNLIRKALKRYKDLKLDFFLCDSGEYCGIAEWNVVKNEIKIGGYFAIHDTYYPKSIKGYKVVEKIEKNKDWKIIVKTNTKQGLVITRKIA